MSRQMVLRRILSNGDDRQADRLAQTLPLRRLGEARAVSITVSALTHSLCLSVLLSHLSLTLKLLLALLRNFKEVLVFDIYDIPGTNSI